MNLKATVPLMINWMKTLPVCQVKSLTVFLDPSQNKTNYIFKIKPISLQNVKKITIKLQCYA